MAKNWSAYEAAKEIYGANTEAIAEIGSRFPLFTRTVAMANSEYLLDILKALPKTTARVVETGLKDLEQEDEVEESEAIEETEEKEEKKAKKTAKKKEEPVEEPEEEEEDEDLDYESMTTKQLYKLCCDRGISSKCKKRDKATLIKVLKENEAADEENTDAEDEWEEEEEDPYAGKTAMQLYKECKKRGISVKQKMKSDYYANILKKNDAESQEEEEESDDEEWEI